VRTDSSSQPVFDQTALRERRRKHMPIVLGGDFDLSGEVAVICEPLAGRVAALPSPVFAGRWVDDVVDAVHELVSTIIGWLAALDARAKTRHLDAAKRGDAIRLLCDLAQRPALPQISDEMLATGSWVAVLTAMAEPVAGPLAGLLGRGHPPNAQILRGAPSRSERLERLLRETLDRAALELSCYLDRRAHDRPRPPADRTEAARAELAKLGIEAP
jgi:hypothetical protein